MLFLIFYFYDIGERVHTLHKPDPKTPPVENIKLLSNAFNAFKSTRRRSINDMDGEKYYAESGSDLSDSEDSTTKISGQHVKKLYKRLNYSDVENSINKYYFYENKSNNTTQLIKGPNTPPNDEYYPIIVGEETGSQNLYTNKSKFNYDVVNNILYIDNLQGNLKNKSAFVSNLIK